MAGSEVAVVDGLSALARSLSSVVRSSALGKMAPALLPQNPVKVVGVGVLSVHDVGVEDDLHGDVVLGNVADEQSEAVVVKVGQLDVLANVVNLLNRLVVPGGGQTLEKLQRHVLEKLIGRSVVRAVIVKLVNNLHSIVRRGRKLDSPLDSVVFSLSKLVGPRGLNSSLDVDGIGERKTLGVGGDGDGSGTLDLGRRESGLHEKVAGNLVVFVFHVAGVGGGESVALVGNSHNVVAAGILHHEVVVAGFQVQLVVDVKGEVVAGDHTILIGS